MSSSILLQGGPVRIMLMALVVGTLLLGTLSGRRQSISWLPPVAGARVWLVQAPERLCYEYTQSYDKCHSIYSLCTLLLLVLRREWGGQGWILLLFLYSWMIPS